MSRPAGGSSLLGRLAQGIAALVGAGVAVASPMNAQTMPPPAAPAEWVRYAEATTISITRWLQADDEAAVRFRAYLDGTRPAPGQATLPLMLKVWIAADGTVSRVEFAPFAHDQANADLRVLIAGRKLASPPPKAMRQPLRLAIQLDPAPAPSPGASERAPGRQI